MFKFLKSKKKEEENQEEELEESEVEKEETNQKDSNLSSDSSSAAPSLLKLSTEVDRLKASQEAFQEVRKSFTERFNHISEQIGELRSMILERDSNNPDFRVKVCKGNDFG